MSRKKINMIMCDGIGCEQTELSAGTTLTGLRYALRLTGWSFTEYGDFCKSCTGKRIAEKQKEIAGRRAIKREAKKTRARNTQKKTRRVIEEDETPLCEKCGSEMRLSYTLENGNKLFKCKKIHIHILEIKNKKRDE